ncbi:tyrosine--tRNA ligase [Candidatus Berkelbacteria bacterium CG_4_10_14_0_8_um_filter_35_9_33_8]|uniref:Tyrosine--tRNA ligase n=1 Tax=Candidatus Berkelbacteria bacterium CG_4_10_14_0_2_um_filter_35_9_33_12 TaxID=1974499 RepID=A0A2M7W558_9BACT|nr:MAG: tyrosine--tRNA ligase [Candidatus Berkelbacteria bacterium CG23_combo_of_CG06-09_8_20_14_all_33_15]PIS08463.1 MAG: tyrosine--tRNA ligase [Candidatus Berkelbacteria bacterium CG10_big_fil_rev_8_21_14_0_10_33_10]PIZ27910.1 MAG: tyrosine--tRNA ligase [Candidatus Berkelbacteria bacterium CG_4_10_14_0_8_um_filter_35_9_33_8]PJA20916.1 MAG: tyrosine--tRNA ligase [Candidatus Berkelbacteria bacterium CG_4_10_14_0_2_um_filter_35_9_33_12]
MAVDINKKKIDGLLNRGVDEVIDKKNLEKKLLSGQQLRIKFGIDPTSPDIHLGRAIPLLKLRDFQELGHKIVFIIGDFTGLVGDTSDKESERPMLDKSTVKNNLKNYLRQVRKILSAKNLEVKFNSRWLARLDFNDISVQADQFSVADFIARDNIKKRLMVGKRVSLREVLYPLMQGYDSVAIRADVEIGGTDQRFNLLAGRTMQNYFGQTPQDVLMTNLIMGTDGRKMSSSWGNTINLDDSPINMFGKVMKINDAEIIDYFIHCTRYPMNEIDKFKSDLKTKNPRDIKQILAFEIVKIIYNEKEAESAEQHFVSVFQKKEIPSDIKIIEIEQKNIQVQDLLKIVLPDSSGSEVKRLLDQNGVKLAGETLKIDQKIELDSQKKLLTIGKRQFFYITLK